MPIDITMPRLSDTMEQGTVIKWLVAEGDEVSAGDMLADIETDKATMELQAYDDGVVAKIIAGEGATVGVGELIAVLAEEDEDVAEAAASAGSSAGGAAQQAGGSDAPAESSTAVMDPPATSAPSAAPTNNGTASGERVFASPLAKKIASEKGVDLSSLSGSGPSGRIVQADVEAAAGGSAAASAPAPAAAPPMMPEAPAVLEARSVDLSNMRRTIAKRLVESKTTVPHYQVTVSADMGPLMELRKSLNEQLASQGVKLSVNDFLVRASALAMHQHPYVNSRWNESTIEINADVNVGVAISLSEDKGGGLVVATLRHADRMGLRQISAETKRLAKKARERGLSVEEMDGSTFTISNLGMFGVDHFTAIINPPNVAILAVGATIEQPVVKDGELAVGHRMSMTMSSDHRVIDGAMAAEYLSTLKGLLEAPATLLV